MRITQISRCCKKFKEEGATKAEVDACKKNLANSQARTSKELITKCRLSTTGSHDFIYYLQRNDLDKASQQEAKFLDHVSDKKLADSITLDLRNLINAKV